MVPTPLPGLSPFPPRLPPGSIRGDVSTNSSGRRQPSRRSRLNERLNGTSSLRMGEDVSREEVEEEDELPSAGEILSVANVGQSSETRMEDVLWGEMAEGRPSTTIYQLPLGRSSGGSSRPLSTWTTRASANAEADEEACLEADSEQTITETLPRPLAGSTPSSSSSSTSQALRRIQIHGSSIRLLGSETRRGVSGAGRGRTNPIGGFPNSSDPWFELEGPSHSHHVFSSAVAVRSGMWDDLVGLAWSPEGDWLCSGTEAGLVEWKVKRSSRTGFGDSRLC